MAKETGTQAGDGATTATVDKAAEAKAADELAKASETDAVGVAELPDMMFSEPVVDKGSVAADGTGREPAEVIATETAKAAAAEEAAPVETAPAVETTETAAADGEFDADAFAKEYGVKDADLFKDCKDTGAALEVLGRRAGFWSSKYGEQTADVGTSRQEIARLTRELETARAKPAATEDVAGTGVAPPATVAMTAEQKEEYFALQDTDPLAARRMLDGLAGTGAPTGLTAEQVEKQIEQRILERDVDKDEDADEAALVAAHPDWEARRPEMEAVVTELGGFYPPLSDTHALAGLRHQDPAGYAGVMAEMQGGLSYAKARVLVIDHPAAVQGTGTATGPTAQDVAARVAKAKHDAGPGKNASVETQPSSETAAIGLEGLSREEQGAPLG